MTHSTLDIPHMLKGFSADQAIDFAHANFDDLSLRTRVTREFRDAQIPAVLEVLRQDAQLAVITGRTGIVHGQLIGLTALRDQGKIDQLLPSSVDTPREFARQLARSQPLHIQLCREQIARHCGEYAQFMDHLVERHAAPDKQLPFATGLVEAYRIANQHLHVARILAN